MSLSSAFFCSLKKEVQENWETTVTMLQPAKTIFLNSTQIFFFSLKLASGTLVILYYKWVIPPQVLLLQHFLQENYTFIFILPCFIYPHTLFGVIACQMVEKSRLDQWFKTHFIMKKCAIVCHFVGHHCSCRRSSSQLLTELTVGSHVRTNNGLTC